MQMIHWNAAEWRNIEDDEIGPMISIAVSLGESILYAPDIHGGGSLDPSIPVITERASMSAVDAMHERFRAGA